MIAKLVPDPTDIVAEVSRVVSEITGVQLGIPQRVMVQNRLKRRIMELGLKDEASYAAHFRRAKEKEIPFLISLMTTHHTYFFREFEHFEYLEQKLPEIVKAVRARGEKTLRAWSAACSRGQEVYSLSMFLSSVLSRIAPDLKYEILGSDVDAASVQVARNGVYRWSEIKEIPSIYLGKNWARGTGEISNFVKAKDSIRSSCRFETTNLLKLDSLVTPSKFDIIFCRNVFIYFTSEQIKEISSRLLQRLAPEGLIFIGISESLNGLGLPAESCGSSIYRLPRKEVPAKASAQLEIVPESTSMTKPLLKVFCIDDSPSILALLKQILNKQSGFEVVGTAGNGIEAAQKLKGMNVDLITLDIHMPEQNGLEYLQQNLTPLHPPVVIISSVAREDSHLAIRCFEAGAADYVEKPTLSQMSTRSEEIKTKLRTVYRAFKSKSFEARPKAATASINVEFATNVMIRHPERGLRVVLASPSHRRKLGALLSELKGSNQPPTLLLFEGIGNVGPALAEGLGREIGMKILPTDTGLQALKPGEVQLAEFSSSAADLERLYLGRKISVLLYGEITPSALARVAQWPNAQFLIEDIGQQMSESPLARSLTDIVPSTSFAYVSNSFFRDGDDE